MTGWGASAIFQRMLSFTMQKAQPLLLLLLPSPLLLSELQPPVLSMLPHSVPPLPQLLLHMLVLPPSAFLVAMPTTMMAI